MVLESRSYEACLLKLFRKQRFWWVCYRCGIQKSSSCILEDIGDAYLMEENSDFNGVNLLQRWRLWWTVTWWRDVDAVQKVKCKESIIERTLGITPRNLRLHTQVLFASHKGKTGCWKFIHWLIPSKRLIYYYIKLF